MKDEFVAGLRSAALAAVVLGGVGSVGLLRHAQQHPPPLLILLFVIWVAAPFAALAAANLFSKRWPLLIRVTLYIVSVLVTVVSLGLYIDNNVRRRTAHPATVWVAVPPASIILSGIVVLIAAFRRRNPDRLPSTKA